MSKEDLKQGLNPEFTNEALFKKIDLGVFEDDLELLKKVLIQTDTVYLRSLLSRIRERLDSIWPGHKLLEEKGKFLCLNYNADILRNRKEVGEYFEKRIINLVAIYNAIADALIHRT